MQWLRGLSTLQVQLFIFLREVLAELILFFDVVNFQNSEENLTETAPVFDVAHRVFLREGPCGICPLHWWNLHFCEEVSQKLLRFSTCSTSTCPWENLAENPVLSVI